MFKKLLQILLILGFLVGLGGMLIYFSEDIRTWSDTVMASREASSWEKVGNRRGAIVVYTKALQTHPHHPPLRFAIARLYLAEGQLESAALHFEEGLKSDPQNVEALELYSDVLVRQRHYNEAITQLRKALKLAGKDPDLMTRLGDLYRIVGDEQSEPRRMTRKWLFQWAEYYYKLALEAAPERFHPRFNLGLSYQRLERPYEAAKQYCQAVLLRPDSFSTRYNLGLALVEMGLYDEGFRQMGYGVHLLSDQNRVSDAQALAEQAQTVRNTVAAKLQDKVGDSLKPSADKLPAGITPACLAEPPAPSDHEKDEKS